MKKEDIAVLAQLLSGIKDAIEKIEKAEKTIRRKYGINLPLLDLQLSL